MNLYQKLSNWVLQNLENFLDKNGYVRVERLRDAEGSRDYWITEEKKQRDNATNSERQLDSTRRAINNLGEGMNRYLSTIRDECTHTPKSSWENLLQLDMTNERLDDKLAPIFSNARERMEQKLIITELTNRIEAYETEINRKVTSDSSQYGKNDYPKTLLDSGEYVGHLKGLIEFYSKHGDKLPKGDATQVLGKIYSLTTDIIFFLIQNSSATRWNLKEEDVSFEYVHVVAETKRLLDEVEEIYTTYLDTKIGKDLAEYSNKFWTPIRELTLEYLNKLEEKSTPNLRIVQTEAKKINDWVIQNYFTNPTSRTKE